LTFRCFPKEEEVSVGSFDYICHLAAVPGVLGSKISGKPYLKVNTPRLSKPTMYQIIALQEFSKIGVCWAGNPFNHRDTKRSIEVAHLARLMIVPDLRLFSLQKQYDPPPIMFDARGLMGDWNETAALIEQMELVITVDTGVAHLAGAMGKRTWLLVPREYDPRWNEPWYDSIKIFWQQQDWPHLLDKVAEELSRL
jgi:hypothetical protein